MLRLPVRLAPHPLADVLTRLCNDGASRPTPTTDSLLLWQKLRRCLRGSNATCVPPPRGTPRPSRLVIPPAQTPRLCGISPFREAVMTH